MNDLLPFETPGAVERDLLNVISPIEQIIEDARNGRMFVLVDHEDRENEGDLVIPAQMATPVAINFMARYGRGLICLTLTSERVEALGLQLMSMIAPALWRWLLMPVKLRQTSQHQAMSSRCAPEMAAF